MTRISLLLAFWLTALGSARAAESTLTDANGNYEFLDLTPGTYGLREIQPSQYFQEGNVVGTIGGVTVDTGRMVDLVGPTTVDWRDGMRRLVAAWNTLGLALVLNVVTIGVLSTPRLLYFGVDHVNTFVMRTPFVWLPAVMVLAALSGHLLIFRALFDTGRQPH